MPGSLFDNPELYRSVLEDLPTGVFIVDRMRTVRFWNRNAEHLTGHLAHDAIGRNNPGEMLEACDQQGRPLHGEQGPLAMTLAHGRGQSLAAYFRHKDGHRLAVHVRIHAIRDRNEAIAGAVVVFEAGFTFREDWSESPMYGCLDPATGIPSQAITRSVLSECMAGMERSRHGFGLIRLRVLGMDEFRSRHGIQSALPFLRTAARTLRYSLDPGIFVGRWGEDEFILILSSGNRVTTRVAAETVWSLITHSDVSWWGDRFPVQAIVMYSVAEHGDKLEELLNGLEPAHAVEAGRAVGAARAGA